MKSYQLTALNILLVGCVGGDPTSIIPHNPLFFRSKSIIMLVGCVGGDPTSIIPHNPLFFRSKSCPSDLELILIGTIEIGSTNVHAVTFIINTLFTAAAGTFECKISQPVSR